MDETYELKREIKAYVEQSDQRTRELFRALERHMDARIDRLESDRSDGNWYMFIGIFYAVVWILFVINAIVAKHC